MKKQLGFFIGAMHLAKAHSAWDVEKTSFYFNLLPCLLTIVFKLSATEIQLGYYSIANQIIVGKVNVLHGH